MCDMTHSIQNIDLTCPDSVAIVADRGNGMPKEIFFSLYQLAQQKVPYVIAGLQAAEAEDDEVQGAYFLGIGDFLASLYESNDALLATAEGSVAFDITDIRDILGDDLDDDPWSQETPPRG